MSLAPPATGAEAVAAAYDRLDETGVRPVWITLVPRDVALARARDVDPGLPLAGLPFAVKDNIDVAGLPTTAACPGFAYVAQRTAPAVRRLEEAGAILVGKTNLDQFATGLVGTRSPYGVMRSAVDPRFVAGGSSSGSAVAVADGTVAFALGTDTAGSGRVPAAFNAVVGLKPTRGLVSTRGVVPACRSLDCVSVFARDVDGTAQVLAVAAAAEPGDPWARAAPPEAGVPAPGNWRIGVPGRGELDALDPRLRGPWAAAVARAEELAGDIVEVSLGAFCEAGELLYGGPWIAERWASLGPAIDAQPDGLDPVVAGLLRRGSVHSAPAVFRAQHRLVELQAQVRREWGGLDAVLLPTAPTVPTPEEVAADPVDLNLRLGRWTTAANLLDLCAVALPAGRSEDGLPFGVSLLAPAWSDRALLALGREWAREPARPDDGSGVLVAVVGAHLRGQPLAGALTELGGRFVAEDRTAPGYRLFALPGGPPARPGLVRAPGHQGPGIAVELVALVPASLGALLTTVPPPLTIGTVSLADGREVLGFLCEEHATAGAEDITGYGGWRAYLAAQAAA